MASESIANTLGALFIGAIAACMCVLTIVFPQAHSASYTYVEPACSARIFFKHLFTTSVTRMATP